MTDIACFGEILWDMLPSGKVAGGAPFNIVNRATALGADAKVISSIGNDTLGDELIQHIQKMGNDAQFIQRHPTLPTSTVEIDVGAKGEPNYHIVHPVAWDDIKLTQDIRHLVSNAKIFVYSSLGIRDGRSRSVLFDLLSHARLKVCDINLRKNHYIKEVILKMIAEADILRMNEFELQLAAQWLGIQMNSFRDGVIKISQRFQYDTVIATLGGEGAISYRKGKFYEQPVYSVTVKDTVGAGDAFLAAYLTRRLHEDSEVSALKYACVVGGLTASKVGGTPEIEDLEISKALLQ